MPKTAMTGFSILWLGVRTAGVGTACLLAALGASWLHIPLAWILGPMVAAGVFSVVGVDFWFPRLGQSIGQCTVGTAVGLNLTGAALTALFSLIPLMIFLGVLSMAIGAVASLILVRYARLDSKTAYFAMMPGGLAEMANIAQSVGARAEPVALIHAMRLTMVISILPPVALLLGTPGTGMALASMHALGAPEILAVFAAALVGVAIVRLLRLYNPWMIGAMLGAGFVSAAGLMTGGLPLDLIHAGQLLLGVAIGARFKNDVVSKFLKIAFVAILAIGASIFLLIETGFLLAWVLDGDIATSILATAPGGLPEMTVTAQLLHLDVAFVTLFQLIRAFLVNGFAMYLMRLLERLGFFRLV